jgi:hypothetical protein
VKSNRRFGIIGLATAALSALLSYRANLAFEIGGPVASVNASYVSWLFRLFPRDRPVRLEYVRGPLIPLTERNVMIVLALLALLLACAAITFAVTARRYGENVTLYGYAAALATFSAVYSGRLLWWVVW